MYTTEILRIELHTFLICTFRYALGRRSYVTLEASDYIKKYVHILAPCDRQLMIDDIARILCTDSAGDSCDIAVWNDLRKFLLAYKDA